jgi:hypothetical protein
LISSFSSPQSMLVATRKGLLRIANDQVLAHYFPGDSVNQILVDSRNRFWYAAQNLGHFGVKLKRSKDQGTTWEDIAAPALPTKPSTGPMADDPTPWTIELVWELQQGGNDLLGELWAGCSPGSLFRSIDFGDSWQLVESLWYDQRRLDWFGGGNDHSGIHSVLVDPHNPSHLTLAISCGGLWESFDRGVTFTLIGIGQEADYLPPDSGINLNQQDPHRIAICNAHPDRLWIQHHCGQYVSNDRGKNVTRINRSENQDSAYDFGFAVVCDPSDPNRAWFVPGIADQKRYPRDGALCVLRTDNGGQSFTQQRLGLPQAGCFDLIYRHSLIIDTTGLQLAMASTTGHLWTTQNAGDRWQQSTLMLPPVYALAWLPT